MDNLFYFQNKKLYFRNEGVLVGVEIYPDKITFVEGTETELEEGYIPYTRREIMAKWQISAENPYIFPVEEVKSVDAVSETKKSTRKSPRK